MANINVVNGIIEEIEQVNDEHERVEIELRKRLAEKDHELQLAYAKIDELRSQCQIQSIAAQREDEIANWSFQSLQLDAASLS